jgi:hypothetical protein
MSVVVALPVSSCFRKQNNADTHQFKKKLLGVAYLVESRAHFTSNNHSVAFSFLLDC